MTAKLVRGACPHDCPDTCEIVSEVQSDRVVDFRASNEHPITQGWLCAKVRPYLKHVYHPDRIQHPLRRAGPKGSGQWKRITWSEAISEIGDKWRALIDQFGAESILPYSYSGTLGLVQMSVASARFWNRLGASQLERTICCAASAVAVEATLGARRAAPYDHVMDSKLIVIWGHNPFSTAPHFMPHLRQAQRQGAKLVVVDPVLTGTAKSADLHIAPLPGTDGALALSIAHLIVRNQLHDENWLAANTVGWAELRERLAEYPPSRAAKVCGIAESQIHELAQLYASEKPGLIKIADGIQRNLNGGQAVRAICALPALTAQYGVRGGGLSYATSGYYQWDVEAVGHASECPPRGRSVNMTRLGQALHQEVNNPPIKSLYVFGANPVASNPNARLIVEGLRQDDLFTVVHELFLTDTADYADLVLPATSQLEQTDLHRGYGHTYLTYNHAAIKPLGESKSNWDVMRLLAAEMGFDEPWLSHEADAVIDEVLTATAGNYDFLKGLNLQRLRAETTVAVDVPDEIPFADLRFPTPSNKIELYSKSLLNRSIDPLPCFGDGEDSVQPPRNADVTVAGPLCLVTGASHHFVSSSLANHPDLRREAGDPILEIHPQDATSAGIQTDDLVTVANRRGRLTLRAVVTDRVRPGVVASPKGYWPKMDPWRNGNPGRNINWVTSDLLADMGGQSTFHSTRVWVWTH